MALSSHCLSTMAWRSRTGPVKFSIGDFVNARRSFKGGFFLAVIVNITKPLGFRLFDVLFVDTGEKTTVSRIHIEPVPAVNEAMQVDAEQPTVTASRFEKLSTEELEILQNSSKSEKTHKMTRWGVKIFQGMLFCIGPYILKVTLSFHDSFDYY